VSGGRIAAGVASIGVVAAVGMFATGAAAQEADDLVTLTIGQTQDMDSPNVTAGYLVSSFEMWTLEYATLTDKAADDFATTPGLAESWEASDDGLTYTYTLRDGLEWSDGEPLTAEDVAYTINRSRDEEWLNHASIVANLDATVIDASTVRITSSVPDPKLPTMDSYIVPKHIYEAISADDIATYDALDGVGSGPYTLSEWRPGESWTMTANPNYHGWGSDGPVIDRVVFRVFDNADAMAAALEQGEIDAANNLPSEAMADLDADPDIVAVEGQQGSFAELGLNAGAGGIGDGHPALLDEDVRHAVAMAIDRQTIFERVVNGIGEVGSTISPSADPSWQPEVPADMRLDFDPDSARALLDEAGYVDADGDGVRDMPDGSRDLTFRYAERSESVYEPAIREFITGYLDDIGIATTVETYDDSALTGRIGAGTYDMFVWGWTPYVDPDPMLSYFTCDQVTTDADNILYNDANWCDEGYDALYAQQNVELDPDVRHDLVHEMLLRFYDAAPYVVLFEDVNTQAYRTDRFEGWLRQPKDIGPVLFTNSSPTYVNLSLVGGGGDDGGGGIGSGVLIAIVAAAVVLAIGGTVFVMSRRGSVGDRE
jgi:peptide/nickel transport system substrate-binding protein